MFLKSRPVPEELKVLRCLNTRVTLSEIDKADYLYVGKGYEGEVTFDLLTENLQEENLTLRDLLLEVNGNFFQIDSIIISQRILNLFEIKNHEGDYYYEAGDLYKKPQKIVKDPVLQLARCQSLLRQLLQNLGFKISVVGLVVQVNPEYCLYQAPLNLPFIFPPQLNRFVNTLNSPSKLNTMHRKLADKLISLHHTKNPYARKHKYSYEQLKKGVFCFWCGGFFESVGELSLNAVSVGKKRQSNPLYCGV